MIDVNSDIVFIDKPEGITSFGVVARVRKFLSMQVGRKVKVGHCGTLDPFATGLMIIVVGNECKNAGTYTKLDKVYEATFVLGSKSTTFDVEGELSQVSDSVPDKKTIVNCLEKFVGDIEQRPPKFSAIKIGGQRAYNLARSGKDFEIPARTVTIYSAQLVDYSYPEVKIRLHVGSGTYIRSIANDLGDMLGTGAYCKTLRRTSIGKWSVASAVKLDEL